MNQSEKKSSSQLMREVIQRVAVGPDRGRDISISDAENVMHAILEGGIDDVQIAVFLIALRMKRESLDECMGVFKAMQKSVDTIDADVDELVCLADPFDGYARHLPMSPFLPAVLAACGMPTLMHGVETVGPKHGITACKVYKLAGIAVDLNPTAAAKVISMSGWAYLDQSKYANALFGLNQLRDRIVKRTVITTLERLLMPIKAQNKTHFVLGYVHKAYPQIYGAIAQLAGYDSALLIKGVEGGLTPALNKPLRRYFFDGQTFKTTVFESADTVDLQKEVINLDSLGDADKAAHAVSEKVDMQSLEAAGLCLALGREVLSGKKGVARDSLCLAAAQILWAHKRVDSLNNGIDKVAQTLDDGTANSMFNIGS